MKNTPHERGLDLKMQQAFAHSVPLKIVWIHLLYNSGDIARDLASDYTKSFAALEEYAASFNLTLEDAYADVEKAMGTDIDTYISMIAQTIFEAVQADNPDWENMNWKGFVVAMKKSPKVQALFSNNPAFVQKALAFIGKSFAEAIFSEDRQGEIPDDDDAEVAFISKRFLSTANILMNARGKLPE